ncbi:MAG: radical SAM protein [Proteobacteria bacterium]|nr:radical SAM protein [Pseudomonadota bacterium]
MNPKPGMGGAAEPAIERETNMGRDGTKVVRGESRPAFMNRCQPKMTYSGHPIREVPWTLPYWTDSLCPECGKVIRARKFCEGKAVFMEKECAEHGYFRELISPDVDFYMSMFTFRFGDQRGITNPLVQAEPGKSCPENCGLCNMHHSHTAMSNIDLTNRCDMTCPVCFANANAMGYVTEPSVEDVRMMLKTLRDRRPVPCKVIQFSGGEPTIHPDFIEIVAMAKEMGFGHIQIATNGKNISDLDFARRCREAGLDSLYLQFDGVTRDVYKKTRAEDCLEMKLQVVEVCRKVGLRIVLVPTVIRGINDDQVGAIVRFACDNSDVVTGISFQPVCFTGRIAEKDRMQQRYTITHLALDVEEQTGGTMPRANWFGLGCTQPLSRISEALSGEPAFFVSCHPDCGGGGYLFINPEDKNEVKALPEFFDMRGALCDLQALSEKLSARRRRTWYKLLSSLGIARSADLMGGARALRIVRKHFDQKRAPTGLTFRRLLGVMDGYKDTERGRRPEAEKKYSYNTIFVAGMHFQDRYNYDCERVRRCVIHQSAPDGRMYPFCTYNSGPYYRARVEEKEQTTKLCEYKESGSPHSSADRKKRFPADPSLPQIAVKDYGVREGGPREYHIPDNYGCCSTAKA